MKMTQKINMLSIPEDEMIPIVIDNDSGSVKACMFWW